MDSRVARRAGGVLFAALLAGCGGDGGAGSASAEPMDPAPAGETVSISGTVTFELVPAVPFVGLDYANTEAAPARGVTVELVSADGDEVLDATVSDAAGAYSLAAPAQADVFLRAKAEMVLAGAPSWDYRVVDNTASDALYVLDGAPFDSGVQDTTQHLHAASGWDGSGYGAPRSAAPFAILDAVYDATQFVLDAAPDTAFPPLLLHWSEENVPTEGERDLPAGEIGSSFFFTVGIGSSRTHHIYLLGAENNDTEEYDRHVIVHEWGHYFESAFSRSDSIGGPHARHEQLDMRTAFGEGWGTALSAMVTGDSVYRDVLGFAQGQAPALDIENPLPVQGPNQHPGWYSEESVQAILFDLFDAEQDIAEDTLALGFEPIYRVLTTEQRDAIALTSLFTFIHALKEDLPHRAAEIDALVATQDIAPITGPFGEGRTNAGGQPPDEDRPPPVDDILPIYNSLDVAGAPVEVCSTNYFEGVTGAVNKLGSRQFLRFETIGGTHAFTATATLVPEGESADPDMVLHQRGVIEVSEDPPVCTAETPLECSESFSMNLAGGEYVLEVYEWTHTTLEDEEFPPIGRTCFDVEVTRQ